MDASTTRRRMRLSAIAASSVVAGGLSNWFGGVAATGEAGFIVCSLLRICCSVFLRVEKFPLNAFRRRWEFSNRVGDEQPRAEPCFGILSGAANRYGSEVSSGKLRILKVCQDRAA
jgi:hypothetical protein